MSLAKKIGCLLLAVCLVAVLVPMTAGAAASTSSLTVTFQGNYVTTQGKVQYSLDDGANWVDVTSPLNNQTIAVTGDNLRLKVVPESGYRVDFTGMSYRENSDDPTNLNNDNTGIAGGLTSANGYLVTATATSVELASVEFAADNGGGGGGGGPAFDGNAYFVWSDGRDVGYKKFTGLQGRDSNNTYPINYIRDTDLSDAVGLAFSWSLDRDNMGWVRAADVENNSGVLDTDKMTYTNLFTGDPYDRPTLDPTGGDTTAANSYSTNADRNFRATIYNAGSYEAIEFSAKLDDYTYFPGFWDPVFFSSTVDISGSTEAKPVEYEAFLLEETIKFKAGSNSANAISRVEVADDTIPVAAVTVTNNSGNWEVTFHSNYYEKVPLKITAGGEDYYVQINRIIMQEADTGGGERAVGTVKTFAPQLWYPTPGGGTCPYEMVALITYTNGATETRPLSVTDSKRYDWDNATQQNIATSLGEVVTPTDGSAKGLSYSTFDPINVGTYTSGTDVRYTVRSVELTVVKTGGSASDFSGALSGSGKGTKFEFGYPTA